MALFSWSYKRRSWGEQLRSVSLWFIVAVSVAVSVVTWTWPFLALIGAGVILEKVGILPRLDKFFRRLFSSFRWPFSKPSTKEATDETTEILPEEEELNLIPSSSEDEAIISHEPTEQALLSEEFTMLPESLKTTLLELYATEACQTWLKMKDKAGTLSLRYSRFYKPDHSQRSRLETKANNVLCAVLSADAKEQAHAEANMQNFSRHLWEQHPEIRHLDFSSVSFQGKSEAIRRFQPLLRQLLLSNPFIMEVTFHPKDSDLADTKILVDTLMEPHKIAQAVHYCVQQNHSTVCTPLLWQNVRDFIAGVIQRVLTSRASLLKSEISTSSENLHAMVPPEAWVQEVEVAPVLSNEPSTSGELLAASHSTIGNDEAEGNEREVEESAVEVVQEQKEDNVEPGQTLLQIADMASTQEEILVKPTVSEVLAAKKALAEKIINRYVEWDNLNSRVETFNEAALQKEAPAPRFPILSYLKSKISNKKPDEGVREEAKKARQQKAKEEAQLAARKIIQLSLGAESEASLDSQLRTKIREFSPEVLENKQADSETLAIYIDAYHILNNILVDEITGMHQVIVTPLTTRESLSQLRKWDAHQDAQLEELSQSNVRLRKGFAKIEERQTKIAEDFKKIAEGQAKIAEGQAKIAEDFKKIAKGQRETRKAAEKLEQNIAIFADTHATNIKEQRAELEEMKIWFMEANGWTRAELNTEMAKVSGKAVPRANRANSSIFGFGYSPLVSSEKPQEKLPKEGIASVLLQGYSRFSCQQLTWDTLTLLKNHDTSSVSLALCGYQFVENRVKLHRQKKAQSTETMETLNAHLGCLSPYFQLQSVTKEVALPQRDKAMWVDEKYFLLYLLVSPTITALNFEHIKVPAESLDSFNTFLDNVLMFNPHITHITLHPNNEAHFPDKLQIKLEENRQWQAANHYAKMTSRDYQQLKTPFSQKEIKGHLRRMAKAYLDATESSIMTWLGEVKPNSPPLKDWESLHEQVTHFFNHIRDVQEGKKHYVKVQEDISEYTQQLASNNQLTTPEQEVDALFHSFSRI